MLLKNLKKSNSLENSLTFAYFRLQIEIFVTLLALNSKYSLQNSKYSSSSNRYSSNYYRDRDSSPKRIAHRSPSPDAGSPRDNRDRYHQSSSYRSKDRDRDYKKEKYPGTQKKNIHFFPQWNATFFFIFLIHTSFTFLLLADKRGRDRELEYKNYKKAKNRDRSSSEEDHKESDRLYEKTRYTDRDHNAVRRTSEKDRRYGDWKEMISKGSGKKYYYNERDKSSQWEKPEEWVQFEM
jgi:WW domain